MHHQVHAGNIAEPVSPALRARHRRPGDGIDFIERKSLLDGKPKHMLHRETANPIGDETRRVFAADDAFAENIFGELPKAFQQSVIGIVIRNDLQQTHIAWRIEKMRAEKPAPMLLGQAFGHFVDR